MHSDLRCCSCLPHAPASSAEKLWPCGARDAMGEFGGDCSSRDIHSFHCCRHGPIRNPTCRSASASAHGWFDLSALLWCKPAASPPGSSLRSCWCRQWGRCARTPHHGEDISASCAFQRRVCFLQRCASSVRRAYAVAGFLASSFGPDRPGALRVVHDRTGSPVVVINSVHCSTSASWMDGGLR